MRAAILTIGDELLIGQVLNTNVQYLSEQLTEIGFSVTRQLTVGDQLDEILKALSFIADQGPNKSDVVIISGGLGPTHDDITMQVLSEYFKTPLAYDEHWISQIETYFKSRGRVMSENNKKQGFLLKNATRLENDCGTAAGQHYLHQQTHYFVVPGVPHELKSMFERLILPILSKQTLKQNERILKQTLQTTGLGESALAERLNPFVQKIKAYPNVSLAFLPSSTVVRLRLQMTATNEKDDVLFSKLLEELKSGCAESFFAIDPMTLEELLVRELQNRKQTVAFAESCTGGYLSHRITMISGSTDVFKGGLVSYQEEIKDCELGITSEIIEKNGVVSAVVARMMAEGIKKKWNTDFGIGITGYLGMGGGDEFAKPGTVWIALATSKDTFTRSFNFENDRQRGKERASQAALDMLRRELLNQ